MGFRKDVLRWGEMVGVEQRKHCTEGAPLMVDRDWVGRRRRPPPRLPPGSVVSGIAANKLTRWKSKMTVRPV
jgi:hypothetical protein